MNLKEVKELLKIHDTNALKKYGQNFLIDDNMLKKIASHLGSNKAVLEIGPGLGSLTRYLIEYYQNVIVYEIDPKMVEVLNDTIGDKITIKEGDFLKTNLKEDLKDYDEIYMIANLPYYITTPILLKVLEETTKISKIVILIQTEVADRFLGKPKTKEYNSLSVLIQTFMNVTKLFSVSKESFYPIPNVDSTVILLERKKELDYKIDNLDKFLKINRLLFRQRRKTIYNNLKDIYSKEQITSCLNELNINTLKRSEELSILEITKLCNLLSKNK